MRIRSFIIAYALVLAILLFADRRPNSLQPAHYSHVIDLTAAQSVARGVAALSGQIESPAQSHVQPQVQKTTSIIAPAALIPGTWSASQIPAERLVAPLVVLDLKTSNLASDGNPISLDDISVWESQHGMIPQGAVIAIRRTGHVPAPSTNSLPIERDAAIFLMDARYTIGFAVETPVTLRSDLTLARQLALHGTYVVEGATRLTSLPATGSLIMVAPAVATQPKDKKPSETNVRVLAMVR